MSLGSLAELEDSTRLVYDHPCTVSLYEALEAVLYPEEIVAVQRLKPGSRILDIGCGTGREARALARLGHQVTALDISPAMLEAARRCAEREGLSIRFVLVAPAKFDAPPHSFDAVFVSQEVYSYTPSRVRRVTLLKQMRHLLTEEGLLLLFQSIASRQIWGRFLFVDLLRRVARKMGDRLVSEPGDGWAVDGSHRLSFKHFFFSSRELNKEIAEGGFQLEDVTRFVRICRPRKR